MVRHAGCECLNVLGPLHEAETVAQPLNHGAPDKNATLEGVLQAMTMLRRDIAGEGSQQAMG